MEQKYAITVKFLVNADSAEDAEEMVETACEKATVITLREEGAAEVGDRKVPIVPAWRWLLEP